MSSIVDGLERFFDGMGLMTGPGAIPKRMIIGAMAGGFLITYFKPKIAFETGLPRPWILTADGNGGPDPTFVPWWTAPVAGAVVGGVLI